MRPVFHEPTTEPGEWATNGPGAGLLLSGDLAGGAQLRVAVGHDHNVHVGAFGPDPDPQRLSSMLDRARASERQTDRYIGLIAIHDGERDIVTHVHYGGNLRPAFTFDELVQFARAYLAERL